jgi:hypothetical protein
MFATLEFVMVACLFADLLVVRGAALLAWAKGAETTVTTAVTTAVNDVKKL